MQQEQQGYPETLDHLGLVDLLDLLELPEPLDLQVSEVLDLRVPPVLKD